ncbi:hypothetical protein BVX98_07210 [bacterium F11]|nr:hypothetical protein BVX98_07210 [bacterium F11]
MIGSALIELGYTKVVRTSVLRYSLFLGFQFWITFLYVLIRRVGSLISPLETCRGALFIS